MVSKKQLIRELIRKLRVERQPFSRREYLRGLNHKDYQKRRRALQDLEFMGLTKLVGEGQIAWVDYYDLDAEIEKTIVDHRDQYLEEPDIETIALKVGRPSKTRDFQASLHRVARRINYHPKGQIDDKGRPTGILMR